MFSVSELSHFNKVRQIPVMQYIGDDDGEETEEQHCSTGVDHWMEHFHWNQR